MQTEDAQSKRRLYEVLTSQGFQLNQQITFLSDGEDAVRNLQLYMSPEAEHILDWWYVTQRLTVLDQYGKGLVHCDPVLGESIRDKIDRLQWSLWNGNLFKALYKIDNIESLIQQFPEPLEPQSTSRFLVWPFVNLHAIMRLKTHSIAPF